MDRSPHKCDFVNVNGVRLHYLDWGGAGDVILFLAGMGCNAHIFDNFAPRFADRFHAMALTRRGHGQSDHPESGYDIDILTEDIRQFLDTLEIGQVILAGHSMAHIELSHFAALYPERVFKLVFLDAAYDRTSASFQNMLETHPLKKFQPPDLNDDYYSVEDYFASIKKGYPSLAAIWGELMEEQALHEIMQMADGKVVDRMTDAIGQAFNDIMTSYVAEDAKIKAPTLSIYAISNGCYYLADDWMTEAQKVQVEEFFETVQDPCVRENVERFQRNVPHAKIVVLPKGHHYCFIKKEETVYEAMREFLLD